MSEWPAPNSPRVAAEQGWALSMATRGGDAWADYGAKELMGGGKGVLGAINLMRQLTEARVVQNLEQRLSV